MSFLQDQPTLSVLEAEIDDISFKLRSIERTGFQSPYYSEEASLLETLDKIIIALDKAFRLKAM